MEGPSLGSYRIISLLGAGGMGEVYRAFDERLQREIAIKVLPASNAHDPAAAGRLVREARAAAALNHPNICTIHEVARTRGRPSLRWSSSRALHSRARCRQAQGCRRTWSSITGHRSPTPLLMPTSAESSIET